MAADRDTKNMTLRLDESLAESVQAIAAVEETSISNVVRDALEAHVAARRADPDFQKQLKRNLERHAELLSLLADG